MSKQIDNETIKKAIDILDAASSIDRPILEIQEINGKEYFIGQSFALEVDVLKRILENNK